MHQNNFASNHLWRKKYILPDVAAEKLSCYLFPGYRYSAQDIIQFIQNITPATFVI